MEPDPAAEVGRVRVGLHQLAIACLVAGILLIAGAAAALVAFRDTGDVRLASESELKMLREVIHASNLPDGPRNGLPGMLEGSTMMIRGSNELVETAWLLVLGAGVLHVVYGVLLLGLSRRLPAAPTPPAPAPRGADQGPIL